MSFLSSEFARARYRLNVSGPAGASAQSARTTFTAGFAMANYDARRERDNFFPEGLFADPAWDILLDLYIAGYLGKDIGVSSACVGASVPQTTGLRWLDRLVELGLVNRSRRDGRSITVSLSDEATVRMTDLLAAMSARIGPACNDAVARMVGAAAI